MLNFSLTLKSVKKEVGNLHLNTVSVPRVFIKNLENGFYIIFCRCFF